MEYGFLSLLPPCLTIIVALTTREVLQSLVLGIFSGFLILHHGNALTAILALLDNLVNLFAQAWITKTLIFSLLVGSVMRLMMDSGGVSGLVQFLTANGRFISSPRSAQFLAYGIGLAIFIESSITSLVAGAVSRSLFDKYGVSRQKLAYICDSTSAPVCALLPLNGWGALLLGLLTAQVNNGTLTGKPVELLIKSIPYNFYAWLSLVLLFWVIWRNWNIGPMSHYETKSTPIEIPIPAEGGHLLSMLIPLFVLVAMMPLSLYFTGKVSLIAQNTSLATLTWIDIIFAGSGSSAVFYAIFTTLLVTFVQYVLFGRMTQKLYFNSFFTGASELLPIVVILILAFMIGNLIKDLQTAQYLASLTQGWLAPAFIPMLLFLLSSIIAFATGTSWGTFSIMLPIGIALASATGADIPLVIGAVVSGGVFGDHASPISDTTIIASLAAGCDVIEHTHSQLPYALLAAAGSVILFTLSGLLLAYS